MRTRRFCFVLFVAATVAAACASSSATYNPQEAYPQAALATQAPATAAPAYPVGGDGVAGSTPAPADQPVSAASAAGPAATIALAAGPESQIVKTGTISVQVAAVDPSIARATDLMHGFGGWLAGSDRTTGAAQEVASVTYRIPVARFEDALAAMRTLGTKVLSEHTDSTAVGGQIVDLQARIANLKASEKAIQAALRPAERPHGSGVLQHAHGRLRGAGTPDADSEPYAHPDSVGLGHPGSLERGRSGRPGGRCARRGRQGRRHRNHLAGNPGPAHRANAYVLPGPDRTSGEGHCSDPQAASALHGCSTSVVGDTDLNPECAAARIARSED